MSLKNRLGNFLLFVGLIAGLIFFAYLFSTNQQFNLGAFLISLVAILVGLRWSRTRGVAPAAPKAAPPPPPPAPSQRPPAAPKKPSPLAILFKGPPAKAKAPPPPPPPKKKRGFRVAALFSPKPKKK